MCSVRCVHCLESFAELCVKLSLQLVHWDWDYFCSDDSGRASRRFTWCGRDICDVVWVCCSRCWLLSVVVVVVVVEYIVVRWRCTAEFAACIGRLSDTEQSQINILLTQWPPVNITTPDTSCTSLCQDWLESRPAVIDYPFIAWCVVSVQLRSFCLWSL